MKRTITVLQEDIDNGKRLSSLRCPEALAARRALADLLPEDTDVCFGPSVMSIFSNRMTIRVILPPEAQHFVHAFDTENPVQPFTFEIDLDEGELIERKLI